MTLSFTAHWHDELPGFYTALKPTPLQNARLIWHNDALADSLGIPSTLFQPEKGAGVWGGETLLPGLLNSVDFPQPFAPTRTVIFCWGIAREISSTMIFF